MREYIKKHYGSQQNLARELGVSAEAVRLWVTKNPRGILKYAPEIITEKNTTAIEVVTEVMYHEDTLRRMDN